MEPGEFSAKTELLFQELKSPLKLIQCFYNNGESPMPQTYKHGPCLEMLFWARSLDISWDAKGGVSEELSVKALQKLSKQNFPHKSCEKMAYMEINLRV